MVDDKRFIVVVAVGVGYRKNVVTGTLQQCGRIFCEPLNGRSVLNFQNINAAVNDFRFGHEGRNRLFKNVFYKLAVVIRKQKHFAVHHALRAGNRLGKKPFGVDQGNLFQKRV